jgi:hypothetical protein
VILDLAHWRVRELARTRRFPPGIVAKIGNLYRFNREALEEWLSLGGDLPDSGEAL